MKRRIFTGLCTALVTPFRGGGVDYEMLENLIRRQVSAGVDAIVLTGTTGESPTLSLEEKLEIYRRGVAAADGKCVILAGTGSNSTAKAVEVSRLAAQTGVDGLLVVTPYYNKATQPGLLKHYEAVCDAAGLPVIAYNVPSRTGLDISVDTCQALSRMEGGVGSKEASGDISKAGKILTACGDDLPLYTGNDDQTVPSMALGGLGVISVVSNVAPEQMREMVSAAQTGDYRKAAEMNRRLLPLMDLLFCQVNPIPVKAAMGMIGLDCGPCRMPLDELTHENAAKLRRCLDELGICAYNR